MRSTTLVVSLLATVVSTGCNVVPHYRLHVKPMPCETCFAPVEQQVVEASPCPCEATAPKRFFNPLPKCDPCAEQWHAVEPDKKQVGLFAEPPLIDEDRVEVVQAVTREAAGTTTAGNHAPDFSWAVGTLEYSNIKKQWRLRYASFDCDDVYGGVLSLTGIEELPEGVRDGGKVWVTGQISRTEGRRVSAPEYFVHEMKTHNE